MPSPKLVIPAGSESIAVKSDGRLEVPDHPIIPFIEGDGTGPDIWRAAVRVLDAAVEQAHRGRRQIAGAEVFAGATGQVAYGGDCPPTLLPDEPLDVLREFLVALKAPPPPATG